MNIKQAKKMYKKNHAFNSCTIKELREFAKRHNIFVYGDKAQILQCIDQAEFMLKIFNTVKVK